MRQLGVSRAESTPADWAKRAVNLMQSGNLESAASCWEKAGDKARAKVRSCGCSLLFQQACQAPAWPYSTVYCINVRRMPSLHDHPYGLIPSPLCRPAGCGSSTRRPRCWPACRRQRRSRSCSALVGGTIYLQASNCMHANVSAATDHRFCLCWECWLIWCAWLCAGMELLEHTTRAQVNPAFAPPAEKDKVGQLRELGWAGLGWQ